MESLARIVAIIMATIVMSGFVAYFLGRRKPQGAIAKLVGVLFGGFSLVAGSWLALLQVGLGARLIGAVVALAGFRLLFKTFRR